MNDEANSTTHPQKTWLEKLSQAFSREPQDSSELIELLREAQSKDIISTDALSMIECVLQVAKMQVRDIMIPRAQMVVVREDASPKDFLPILIDSRHSRFPVVSEDGEHIKGILLAKDLLDYNLHNQNPELNIAKIIRPAVFVPESKRLDILLKEFRISHNHMAIVADEYGGIAGLVTIEDVLEQIVGEIEDETDIEEEDDQIKPHEDGSFIVKAQTTIDDFNDYFKSSFSDEEFDTIGGIVVQAFERLPKRGERILIQNFEFKILHADNRRIRLLQICPLTQIP